MKSINISLFRVSADSKYLDIMFELPGMYKLTNMTVRIYQYTGCDKDYQISEFEPNIENLDQSDFTIRLSLNENQPDGLEIKPFTPIICQLELNAKVIKEYEDSLDCDDLTEIQAFALASDVNFVFDDLMNDVLTMGDCGEPSSDLMRNYMILFAHQEAMRLSKIEEAKKYYKILAKKFNSCCNNNKSYSNSSIGCGCTATKSLYIK